MHWSPSTSIFWPRWNTNPIRGRLQTSTSSCICIFTHQHLHYFHCLGPIHVQKVSLRDVSTSKLLAKALVNDISRLINSSLTWSHSPTLLWRWFENITTKFKSQLLSLILIWEATVRCFIQIRCYLTFFPGRFCSVTSTFFYTQHHFSDRRPCSPTRKGNPSTLTTTRSKCTSPTSEAAEQEECVSMGKTK